MHDRVGGVAYLHCARSPSRVASQLARRPARERSATGRPMVSCIDRAHSHLLSRPRTFSSVPAKSMVLTPRFCMAKDGRVACEATLADAMLAPRCDAARAMDRTACFSATCLVADRRAVRAAVRVTDGKDILVWCVRNQREPTNIELPSSLYLTVPAARRSASQSSSPSPSSSASALQLQRART